MAFAIGHFYTILVHKRHFGHRTVGSRFYEEYYWVPERLLVWHNIVWLCLSSDTGVICLRCRLFLTNSLNLKIPKSYPWITTMRKETMAVHRHLLRKYKLYTVFSQSYQLSSNQIRYISCKLYWTKKVQQRWKGCTFLHIFVDFISILYGYLL